MTNSIVRNLRLLAFALAAVGCDASSAVPRSALYDAYVVATLTPHEFDHYSDSAAATKHPALLDCLEDAQTRLAIEWQMVVEECDAHPEVSDRVACKATDHVGVSLVLDGIRSAVRDEVPYAQSKAGSAALLGRGFLGASEWERANRAWLPVLRTVLQCG